MNGVTLDTPDSGTWTNYLQHIEMSIMITTFVYALMFKGLTEQNEQQKEGYSPWFKRHVMAL